MRISKCLKCICCLLFLAIPITLVAQSDVGGVTGTVTDVSGAVVSNAAVELRDLGTNNVNTTKTNQSGQYVFPRVTPGQYSIKVAAPGFSAASVTRLTVSVGKTALANVTLKVGEVSQIVEVQAGAATELQTLDASVGNVISANQLANMPNLNRDATTLILYQPGAIPSPSPSTDENVGGQIAGARSDQNTFMIDGGDATSNTDANSAYTNNFYATPRAAIPTPVESLEEFRVVTNNSTAGFGRSAGAEVQMVTRRGTNAWHGALYEYMVQDETNSNTWERKRTSPPTPNPEWRDGRFGARLGGPVITDKTFFFAHWESRHFLQGDTINRWAPTASIRSGLLGYIDANGAKHYINPATQDCNGNPATPPNTCDPRGLGLDPTIRAIWNQMPLPDTSTGGDGVNFLNYTSAATRTVNEEFGVARFDHQISQNWHAQASYRYGVTDQSTLNQVQVFASGSPKSLSARPAQPRYVVFGLTGQLTPNISNDLHLDYLRHWWQWGTAGAQPQLPGLGGAIQIANEGNTSGVVPINIDTQQARQRNWNGKDWNLIDNVTWLKGKHMVQFGGHYGWERLFHSRDDIVTYALNSPVYYALWNSSHGNISGINVPADASSGSSFRRAYVSMLGLIEEANQVRVRDGSLNLKPSGSRITQHTIMDNWEIHFADAWRMAPSLTVTYGLGWSVQLPPYEQNGAMTMMVDTTNNNHVFSMDEYLNTKAQNALQGKAWNPTIGYMPIKDLKRKYPFDVDYTNFSPRLAAAWNPSISRDTWLGRLFGDRKTVIRGGWTRAFDRLTGVDLVMTPALGIGFSQSASCRAPLTTGACGGTSTPLTGFRIGTDGNSVTIPDPPPATAPITPGVGGVPFAARDYHIDPRRQVGSADLFDLSVQRELPSRTLLEVGFIGRRARDLYQKIDIDQIPYMYTMGGQTFADAYDKTQAAIVAGQSVPVQPFWEAALGGPSSAYCSQTNPATGNPYPNCTTAVATREAGNFGIRDVFTVFSHLDKRWVSGSFLPSTNQLAGSDITASRGRSSYAALFVSLRKGSSHGLTMDFNYTLSKSLDSYGYNQDIINAMMDAYNPDRGYGPSNFDRRHVFNALATYELPFGRGKRWATSSVMDKLFGGWSTSYVFTASSGLPLYVYNNDSCLEFGDGNQYNDCAGLTAIKPVSFTMSRHDSGVIIGPNGFGSQSTDGTFQGGYPNAFSNPEAVRNSFRLPFFSDSRTGNYNGLRGQKRWNVDLSVGKTTRITERVTTRFELQMINAFNHVMLSDADTDISNPATFGVLNTQYNRPRFMQWGLRFDF